MSNYVSRDANGNHSGNAFRYLAVAKKGLDRDVRDWLMILEAKLRLRVDEY